MAPPLLFGSSEAPVTVIPVMVAVTPESIRIAAPSLLASIVRIPAPGPVIVMGSAWLLSSTGSRNCVRVTVRGPEPRLNVMVEGEFARSACSTAQRKVPGRGALLLTVSRPLVTAYVASSRRSSSISSAGWSRLPPARSAVDGTVLPRAGHRPRCLAAFTSCVTSHLELLALASIDGARIIPGCLNGKPRPGPTATRSIPQTVDTERSRTRAGTTRHGPVNRCQGVVRTPGGDASPV